MAVRAIEPARAYLADLRRRETAARAWDQEHPWN
jgi:hypothetical protein